MTPMGEGILDRIFFYFKFYDWKLSSATRYSCTLPHCLTSGQYGRQYGTAQANTLFRFVKFRVKEYHRFPDTPVSVAFVRERERTICV